eukprot:713382-Hanusia_phi.AAC.1
MEAYSREQVLPSLRAPSAQRRLQVLKKLEEDNKKTAELQVEVEVGDLTISLLRSPGPQGTAAAGEGEDQTDAGAAEARESLSLLRCLKLILPVRQAITEALEKLKTTRRSPLPPLHSVLLFPSSASSSRSHVVVQVGASSWDGPRDRRRGLAETGGGGAEVEEAADLADEKLVAGQRQRPSRSRGMSLACCPDSPPAGRRPEELETSESSTSERGGGEGERSRKEGGTKRSPPAQEKQGGGEPMKKINVVLPYEPEGIATERSGGNEAPEEEEGGSRREEGEQEMLEHAGGGEDETEQPTTNKAGTETGGDRAKAQELVMEHVGFEVKTKSSRG